MIPFPDDWSAQHFGGFVLGEGDSVDLPGISLQSFLAWIYLVVFGAFVAFSAYVWLLKNTSAARASTYAYVNPVVAVFLGWALADEPLNLRIFAAVVLLVSAVVLITRFSSGQRRRPLSKPDRDRAQDTSGSDTTPHRPPSESAVLDDTTC